MESSSAGLQTKTITDFVAEAPNEDVMALWEAFWGILTEIKDRVTAIMPVDPHPSSAAWSDYVVGDGAYEGSLNTYTGEQMEWFVHSWIGNRKASILDMNINIWLGPHIDVPHLCLVFGTIPRPFHYSDFIARKDLVANADYLERYYEDENAHSLEFGSDERFTWSVSHGAYMRAVASPVAYSYWTERDDAEIIDVLRERVMGRFERWLQLVDRAEEVPEPERAALSARDHYVRENCYRRDPMNALSAKFIGQEMVDQLVDLRLGKQQMEESARR